jgi:PASTA domain
MAESTTPTVHRCDLRVERRVLSATLLLGATPVTAQWFPCASVAPEVRERVRDAGACRDATPDDAALKDPASASSAVTMHLSDGTVVRVPREISADILDEGNRTATSKTAARAKASTQSESDASGEPAPALQKLKVPDVIGRSYADAGHALAEFKVDRIETASAAPSGEVLAQEPAPATLMLPGSTVSLHVSDGSLANAADTTPVTAPSTAAAASSTPAPATDSTAASTAARVRAFEPTDPPELQDPRSKSFALGGSVSDT